MQEKAKLLDLLEAFRVHMCTQNHAMEHCVRDGQCPMAYPAQFTVEGNEISTINYCMIETVKAAMSKSMDEKGEIEHGWPRAPHKGWCIHDKDSKRSKIVGENEW